VSDSLPPERVAAPEVSEEMDYLRMLTGEAPPRAL